MSMVCSLSHHETQWSSGSWGEPKELLQFQLPSPFSFLYATQYLVCWLWVYTIDFVISGIS